MKSLLLMPILLLAACASAPTKVIPDKWETFNPDEQKIAVLWFLEGAYDATDIEEVGKCAELIAADKNLDAFVTAINGDKLKGAQVPDLIAQEVSKCARYLYAKEHPKQNGTDISN